MKQKQLKNLVSFFYEIGTLRKILRMHQQPLLAFDPGDNISSHSFRTTFIGYFLAKALKADGDKVIKMCLLHDIEETRSGDQNWIHKRYIKVFEDEIRKGQLKDIPHSQELLELSEEYQERKSLEAEIAKDADILDELFLLKEYELQGNKEATRWLRGDYKKASIQENEQEKRLSTKLAKEIAREIKKQNPSLWWDNLWTSDRRR